MNNKFSFLTFLSYLTIILIWATAIFQKNIFIFVVIFLTLIVLSVILFNINKLKKESEERDRETNKKDTELERVKIECERKLSNRNTELENKIKESEKLERDLVRSLDKNLDLVVDLKKFKMAADDTYEHIVITDSEGIVVYANKSVERITGYLVSEILGTKAGKLWGGLMDKDFYTKMWDIIKNRKQVFKGEIKNKRKNGDEYFALATISPVLDEEKNLIHFVGIERDITKEKEIDKVKTEFVYLASHQLRTPLSAINWFAEILLKGDAGKLTKKQKEYLEEIYVGNQKNIKLVDTLLNISKLELGAFVIDSENFDINKMIKGILKNIKIEAKKKKIKVIENYNKDLKKYFGDKNLIEMIVENLLSNAVKYTKEKGKIEFSIDFDEKYLILISKDEGIGIPDNQKNKIFNKMFRCDNAKKMNVEGTGLGLYMVKNILEKIGGQIKVDSIEDKGSTFEIKIPINATVNEI